MRTPPADALVRGSQGFTRRQLLLATLGLLGPLLGACAPAPGRSPAPAPSAAPGGTNPATANPTVAALPAATPASATPPRAAPAQAAGSPSTVVFANFTESRSLNPLLASDGASQLVSDNIYEALVTPDPQTGAPRPLLAERWEVGPDGRVYNITLRDGVRWSDGQPLRAADVQATIQAARDPQTRSVVASRFDGVEGVDVVDPLTARIRLAEPACPFPSSALLTPILPAHALQAGADLSKSPIGTGPYTLAEWQKDDRLLLVANPSYWRGKPKIDRWVRKVVKDANVVLAQLKTGEADYGYFQPEDLDQVRAAPHLGVIDFFNRNYDYLGWNLARPLFRDKRVRQALAHALDRQQLVDTVLYGLGQRLDSPVPAFSWAFNPQLPRLAYDLGRSRQLLAEAGWAPGPDGVLRDAQGQRFSFTLLTNTGNRVREAAATIAQDQYRKLGLEVKVQLLENNAFLTRLRQSHDFDAVVYGATLEIDPDQTAMWASKSYPEGDNYGAYANPAVDQALAQGRSATGCSEAARKPFYDAFQAQVAEDQPVTFLYVRKNTIAVNKRLRGPAPTVWTRLAWNIHEWTVA